MTRDERRFEKLALFGIRYGNQPQLPPEWTARTTWLVAIFAASEALANILAAAFKLPVGPFLIPGGSFLIPISLLLRDQLHLRHPRRSLWVAMMIGGVVSALFGSSVMRIAGASVLSYWVSFLVDTWVFDRLKRRPFTARMRWSNWASLPVDTLVFVPLAFAGTGFSLWALIPGQILAKLAMTEAAILFYVLDRWWVQRCRMHDAR